MSEGKKLENFEDLFGLDNSSGNQVILSDSEQHEIELSKLVPFINHPFNFMRAKSLMIWWKVL